jgi:hypothetical protein
VNHSTGSKSVVIRKEQNYVLLYLIVIPSQIKIRAVLTVKEKKKQSLVLLPNKNGFEIHSAIVLNENPTIKRSQKASKSNIRIQ